MVANHRENDHFNHDADRPLPLDAARDSFRLLVAGPRPLSLDGRAFQCLPRRSIPLDELRSRLLRPACPPHTRDAVWAHLVQRAREDGATWTLACTGMALPALARTAGRLSAKFPGDPFDVHAEVLAGFLTALTTVDLSRPHVLGRLRWAAYRHGFAALSEALKAPTPVAPGFRSSPPRPPWGHPDLVLARAVREEVLTRDEADLISATRLDEITVGDWAAEHRITPNAAYKIRRRAEARLIVFLHEEARDDDFSDPVAHFALGALPASLSLPARRNAVQALSSASGGSGKARQVWPKPVRFSAS